MPTLTIDIALLALYTALAFGGGWQVESWHLEARHAAELQAQIVAGNAAEKKDNNIAAGFESASRSARESFDQLQEKWRIADAKPHPVCLLSDDALLVLGSATAQGTPAR